MIPNLSVDHVSPIPLARSADVCQAMTSNPQRYRHAFDALGLSKREAAQLVTAICDGEAWYGPLPHHIQAMTGRKRDGRVYVLHHVNVPHGTMGWVVPLDGGVIAYIPRVCGNISISRGKHVARAKATYVLPTWHEAAGTPVAIAPVADTPTPIPIAATTISAPTPTPQRREGAWWIAPIMPFFAGFAHTGSPVPPCSLGSNTQGVCR